MALTLHPGPLSRKLARRFTRLRGGPGTCAWLGLGLLLVPAARGAAAVPPVQVDQTGYAPAGTKWVAVAASAPGFEVVRTADGTVAFSGPLTLRRSADPASGDTVYEGDFSPLTAVGSYRIHVAGVGDSPPFVIHPGVADDLYRKALKGLTYQRCGAAVSPTVGGAWTHDACHDEGAGIASWDWATTGGTPGGYRNTVGGWHDAGDYGKYSTNNAYTVGILLQAYERFPDRYVFDDCGIPESGNGVPDLLDETRWSLEWMLAMEDPGGGVRHRESIANYAGDYLPEADPVTRYYTSVSSDATAAQCAALALAARVYAGVDPAFAAACSTAAAGSWSWLQLHPARVPAGGFQNLYGHTGATYVSGSDVSHRTWAAAEMFRLTGDAAARDYVDAHWGDGRTFNGVWYPDSWGDLANLAAFAYRDAPGATPAVVSGNWWSIENSTLSSAAVWEGRIAADGYGCAATPGDYYWGFTGVVLRYAWTLVEAWRYSGDAACLEAARDQLRYVMGRNPLGKVYATGFGTRPVLHSHGAWNLAGGFTAVEDSLCHPIPYQLVGGPNSADNGDLSPYPGRCYEDIADPDYYFKGNYTLNETSINIQASLIVLAGFFGTGGTAVGSPPGPPVAAVGPALRASPNPFRGSIVLRGAVPAGAAGAATVEIVDVAGRRVAEVPGTVEPAPGPGGVPGRGAVWRGTWDGRDARGAALPSGIYYAHLRGAPAAALRLVLLR